jgi:basic membrane lipoprotein Med (substrate-binding protein (PBP1-ABC) superfamily)
MIVMPISWLARVGHEAAFREALRKGASLVVAVGYTYSAPVAAVARDFPDVEFTVIDVVVEKAFLSGKNGIWESGAVNLGLANGAVGWALDDNNPGPDYPCDGAAGQPRCSRNHRRPHSGLRLYRAMI